MIPVYKGKYAVAYKAVQPEGASLVEGWIINQEGLSPCWSHYFCCVGHLRDAPGLSKATKRFPQATHELRVDAMDSAKHPRADDPKTWSMLTPANVIWQFVSDSDERAAAVCRELVLECIGFDGRQSALCLEPEGVRVNDGTAREYWRERLKRLLPEGTRIE